MTKSLTPRWRVVAQELEGVTNLIIASPAGQIISASASVDKYRQAIRDFVKEHESMRDARFSSTAELAKWLDGLYMITDDGAFTGDKWPMAQRLIEALQAMDTRVPPDWMRVMVFEEFSERLALPSNDEASIGPWDTFSNLLLQTGLHHRVPMLRALKELAKTDGSPDNVRDAETLAARVRVTAMEALAEGSKEGPAVWLTSDHKAYGRASDEQIIEVLRGALADVLRRSGLGCEDEGCPHYGTKHGHPPEPPRLADGAGILTGITDAHEVDGELIPGWAIRRATGLERGAQLPTRDGRRMGNAHIIDIEHKDNGALYTILTDAGNRARMSLTELAECFHSPTWVSDVERVKADFESGPAWADATFLGFAMKKVHEMALGTRFRYAPDGPVFILLDRSGDGLVAEADPNSIPMQGVWALAGTKKQKNDLVLYVEEGK